MRAGAGGGDVVDPYYNSVAPQSRCDLPDWSSRMGLVDGSEAEVLMGERGFWRHSKERACHNDRNLRN